MAFLPLLGNGRGVKQAIAFRAAIVYASPRMAAGQVMHEALIGGHPGRRERR